MASVMGPANVPDHSINYVELDDEKGKKFDQAVKQLGINSLAASPPGKEGDYTSVLKEGKLTFISNQDYQSIQKTYEKTFPKPFHVDKKSFNALQGLGGLLNALKRFYNAEDHEFSREEIREAKDRTIEMYKNFNDELWPKFRETSNFFEAVIQRLEDRLSREAPTPPPPLNIPSMQDTLENAPTLPIVASEKIIPKSEYETKFLETLQKLRKSVDLQLRYLDNQWSIPWDIPEEMKRLKTHYNKLLSEENKDWSPQFKSLMAEIRKNIGNLLVQYQKIVGPAMFGS